MSKKFSKRKIILTEQMNYIEHPPFDDVGIQKNYKPNHLFYFLMILVPACVFLCFFAMLLILKSLNASLVSIIIGIWGSYLASVLVVWLDEIRRSREKTFTRMKFQSVYFSDLKTICMGFASHYIGYLATNYPKECKRHIRTVEKHYIENGLSEDRARAVAQGDCCVRLGHSRNRTDIANLYLKSDC